jgi:hypothetical protein
MAKYFELNKEAGRGRVIAYGEVERNEVVEDLKAKGYQWREIKQPAQPLGLIAHDDRLNTKSDWAEKMVCQLVGAKQTAWNCKGHDGILEDGTKIEVKCASIVWHKRCGKNIFSFSNIDLNSPFNLLIGVLLDSNYPDDISKASFYVMTKDEIKPIYCKTQKYIYVGENSKRHNDLNKFNKCSITELANLGYGYDFFLKMKGKTPSAKAPTAETQYVIDYWVPNKYNLMPYDERFEDSSWYAEFAVAYLLRGVITEQRCAGYDVLLDDGLKVQVKMGNLSKASNPKDCMVTLNALKMDSEYDLLVGLCWDEIENIGSMDMNKTKIIIMDKATVEHLKHPYKKGDYRNGRLYFRVRADGKYSKRHPLTRLRPFMFTIDHLEELGEIGYDAFYERYLRGACVKVLAEKAIGKTNKPVKATA